MNGIVIAGSQWPRAVIVSLPVALVLTIAGSSSLKQLDCVVTEGILRVLILENELMVAGKSDLISLVRRV